MPLPSLSPGTAQSPQQSPPTQQTQHSKLAKSLLMTKTPTSDAVKVLANPQLSNHVAPKSLPVQPPPLNSFHHLAAPPPKSMPLNRTSRNGVGPAASDTPEPSAPTSPRIPLLRHNSGSSTPRMRPTTLDIPGLTKSKVSPDGRIAQRDIGSKLVIVMVGLPARGKSYITRKLARYLNWLQHDTKIFNVGDRRRIATQGGLDKSLPDISAPQAAARALMDATDMPIPNLTLSEPMPADNRNRTSQSEEIENMDQSANFFDPNNETASKIREQCAMDTLDELLDYVLDGEGAVGILDATNSTFMRRQRIMEKIRARAGQVNVLYVESVCQDPILLETNMRLKLSGPDYKDKDPMASLEDFKKRVANYEKRYAPLGEYEERHNMSYVKMIDVGKKMISFGINGFLSSQAVYYLLNFNLAPRQIWITRHGESLDNVHGKIGGDSELSENGRKYGRVLTRFINHMRQEWDIHQQDKIQNISNPLAAGDHTPPNPYVAPVGVEENFCVWTSMLKRSIETGQYFNDDDFDVKQMRMLNELYAGSMEGMTYMEIQKQYADQYSLRTKDKLSYRYPGPGGEGYLDVINRLRPVIVELERMTDHCLIITHRSVARVLLAYFLGHKRDNVANLECPLGMLYALEPKPYGVQFQAYRYNPEDEWFDLLPNYRIKSLPLNSQH